MAGDGQLSSHWLRLCVHHGMKMPYDPTHVEARSFCGLNKSKSLEVGWRSWFVWEVGRSVDLEND